MDADQREAVVAVALVPGVEVGEGANRVELGDVEEVDQRRPRRDQPVDRLDRLADPVEAVNQRGYGDVGARGSQTPEGMLRRSPELVKESHQ
jgi:hypothetical protein